MKLIVHIVLVTLLSLVVLYSNGQEAQNEYIKSSQEKHDFNKKNWSKLKEKVVDESGGRYNSENGGSDGSFYEYDNEGYDGKYSEYQNDDQEYFYEGDEEYVEGDGTGNGEGGGSNYFPQDDNIEHGQQEYHPKDQQKPRYRNKSRNDPSYGGGMGGLQYVLFGLLAVLLAFLIYQLFMKSSLDDRGAKVVVPYDEMAPTEIPKSELELLLEKALSNNDFRAAIRIYFIFIIKDLSEKEWIRWEKKKTNFSYLLEMKSRPQYASFNEVVSVYELVWYGNYIVNKKDFESLEPRFKNLLNSLNSENK